MNWNGILAPICTPFHQDGELHCAALRENLAKYASAGLAGFVAAGSTGEAVFLSREEKRQVFQTVREASAGKLLVAGTGAESVRETLAQIRDAAELEHDAALVVTPHYYQNQMSRAEAQVAFFRAVADESPLPVLLYNFPQMTGIDLPLEAVQQLAGHPNIAGMKESSADLDKVAGLIAGVPTGFPVLVGASAKFHDCLRLGATGGVLAIANALPAAAQRIFDLYRSGNSAGSAEAQKQIAAAAGVAPRFGIAGLKYAMDLKGYYGGPARLPLLPLDDGQKSEIEGLFKGL